MMMRMVAMKTSTRLAATAAAASTASLQIAGACADALLVQQHRRDAALNVVSLCTCLLQATVCAEFRLLRNRRSLRIARLSRHTQAMPIMQSRISWRGRRRKENRDPSEGGSEALGRGRRNANKASETAERAAEMADLKRKQDALSEKKNQETYARLKNKARFVWIAVCFMLSMLSCYLGVPCYVIRCLRRAMQIRSYQHCCITSVPIPQPCSSGQPCNRAFSLGSLETIRSMMQAEGGSGEATHMRATTQVECYSSASRVPPQRHLLLAVDQAHEALLLPLMGVHVPFHINTVKTVTYNQVCPTCACSGGRSCRVRSSC